MSVLLSVRCAIPIKNDPQRITLALRCVRRGRIQRSSKEALNKP